VPAKRVAEVQQALLLQRLSGVTVGDPKLEQVRMGALVSREQRDDVQQKVDYLLHNGCEPLCGARTDNLEVSWGRRAAGGILSGHAVVLCRSL
jgi:oxepin-CoA hydrolase / 3-oxo-5,6-dehydrosuberyl-CoA semialdehyde dehydrogenase